MLVNVGVVGFEGLGVEGGAALGGSPADDDAGQVAGGGLAEGGLEFGLQFGLAGLQGGHVVLDALQLGVGVHQVQRQVPAGLGVAGGVVFGGGVSGGRFRLDARQQVVKPEMVAGGHQGGGGLRVVVDLEMLELLAADQDGDSEIPQAGDLHVPLNLGLVVGRDAVGPIVGHEGAGRLGLESSGAVDRIENDSVQVGQHPGALDVGDQEGQGGDDGAGGFGGFLPDDRLQPDSPFGRLAGVVIGDLMALSQEGAEGAAEAGDAGHFGDLAAAEAVVPQGQPGVAVGLGPVAEDADRPG